MVTALDTETFMARPARMAPPLVCLSVSSADGSALYGVDEAKEVFIHYLKSEEPIVGHFMAYDLSVACAEWPDLFPLVFAKYRRGQILDTGIREKLYHIALGVYRKSVRDGSKLVQLTYGLKALGARYLNIDMDKTTWRHGYRKLRGVPLEQWPQGAVDYAIGDAEVTYEVYLHQEDYSQYFDDQYRQARAEWWLTLMTRWGLRTDETGVLQFEKDLQNKFARAKKLLVRHGLVREDGSRDTKAAMARVLMLAHEKNLPIKLTGKKKVSLSSEVCKAFDDEILETYAEISSLRKRLSNDVELVKKGIHFPIHSRFETLKETGRTGSKGPNLQNLDTDIGARECFVPRPGHVFAAADYSQFELRTISQVCIANGWESRMAEALNRGIDPHLQLAAIILGISYAEAKKRNKAGDHEVYLARQSAKVANFGFPGGMGILAFVANAKRQYGVILTPKGAKELKDFWFQAWPEMPLYFDWVANICEDPTPQIKQVYSNRYRGNVGYTDACNSFFQGLAADAAKAAGFLISEACYTKPESPLYGSKIVNFVHDEFILECPEETAPEAAEELARLMVEGASPFLPDVPPVAEPLLMRRWSKKAKEIRDESGRLVPWDID